ncbi:hypothetical protein LOTGIDRAFT_105832, partial [Lottia gigantea]
YCNIPSFSESGYEGENLLTFQLKAVYTVIRHGDRTTLYSFPKTSNPSISCHIDQSLHPRLTDFIDTMQINTGKQNIGSQFESWALYPNRQICDNSFLTPSGSLQHILNGVHLNEKYVKKLNLFNGEFTPDKVKIKVTEYSRTYQSAVALLYGFLPHFNLTQLDIQLSRGVLFCSTKTVGSVCSCPAIQYYKGRGVQEVAQQIRWKKGKLRNVLKTIANVLNIETSQLPFNFAVFDILSSFVCHNIPLPCNEDNQCITKEHIVDLMDYLNEHARVLHNSASFRKHNSLSSYAILMDIAHHMIDVAQERTNQVFSLYSGHDKTVAPILSVFGLNIGNSVKYGARIVFELYKHHHDKDHYFIKILHHGKDVTAQVNFCKGRTRNGVCKIKYFLDFLKVDLLQETGQKTFADACKIVRKK